MLVWILPPDNFGNKYILSIVDEFSKFTLLIPCKGVDSKEYVNGLLKQISLFGIMEQVRTDGGSQFTANVCEEINEYLNIKHHVVIPYHPQANGIVERRNGEILKHLRALIMKRRIRDKWSNYLCLIQNILNNTVDSSIGTYPSKLLFGDKLKTTIEWIAHRDKDIPIQPAMIIILKLCL